MTAIEWMSHTAIYLFNKGSLIIGLIFRHFYGTVLKPGNVAILLLAVRLMIVSDRVKRELYYDGFILVFMKTFIC